MNQNKWYVRVAQTFNKYMSQFCVVFSILVISVYTVVVLILSYFGAMVPDSLTSAVFAFFGIELLSLAGIKITKRIRPNKSIEEALTEVLDEAENGEEH